MAFPLTQIFMNQYKVAAGEGALVELKLRLLADKVPALQKFAHQQRLQDVEAAIVECYGTFLLEADKGTLKTCCQLRNKILHCDFSAAREKLEALGFKPRSGGVRRVDVAGLSGPQIRDKLAAAFANIPGTSEPVAEGMTKAPHSIYGWLLEMGNGGDFQLGANAFRAATAIVDKLIDINVEEARA